MFPKKQIVEDRLAYDGFWRVRRVAYATRVDGEETLVERDVIEAHDAAAVLPFDPARGCVLLIRQFRLPPFAQHGVERLVEACAGVCEPGEDAAACAVRETREEAGLAIAAPRFVGRIYPSPGVCTERISLFIANYDVSARIDGGGGLAAEAEEIAPFEILLVEALAMIAGGEIVDAKSIILLQRLAMEQGMRLGAA